MNEKMKKSLVLIVLAVLILSLIPQFVPSVRANPDWLSGWQYRKSHVINSAAGAGTNYQMKIVVHYGSGTDSGEDVYLNGNCRTDFGDIRFTDDDGTTELDYWMEEKVDGDYAVFWVEVADDLSSSNATIYVYYGKSDATTTSNGDNTFILFEDAFGSQPEGWQVHEYGDGVGASTFIDDYLDQDITSSNPGGAFSSVYASATSASNFAVVAYFDYHEYGSPSWVYMSLGVANTNDADLPSDDAVMMDDRYDYLRVYKRVNGTSTLLTEISGNFHDPAQWQIRKNGTNYEFLVNGTLEYSATISDVDLSTQYIWWQIFASRSYSNHVKWDWVFMRKYVDPEPSHGIWMSEEEAISTSLNSPEDGAENVTVPTILNVTVYSASGNVVVKFYWDREEGDQLLNTVEDVENGTCVTYQWSTNTSTSYSWYVTVTDNESNVYTSPTWTFTTAEYPTVTFDAEIFGEAIGIVLTVDGIDYEHADLPVSFEWIAGSAHTYGWHSPLWGTQGEKYYWDHCEGLSESQSGVIVVPSGGGEIKAIYGWSGYVAVTYDAPTLGENVEGVVLTVDGVGLTRANLPYTAIYMVGSTHTFGWHSPLFAGTQRWDWVSTHGIATEQSGVFIAPNATEGEIIATYQKTTVQVTFSTNLQGGDVPVLVVDEIVYSVQDLPHTFTWQRGSVHAFGFEKTIIINGTEYTWVACEGISERCSDVIIAEEDGAIFAMYLESDLVWGITDVSEVAGSDATMYPSQTKTFYAEGRFWLIYWNGSSMVYRSAQYKNGRLGAWSTEHAIESAIYYHPARDYYYIESGYYFQLYYESRRNYIHCLALAKPADGGSRFPFYRMGQPKSTGGIEWISGWQLADGVVEGHGDLLISNVLRVAITADTNGYPFVVYAGWMMAGGEMPYARYAIAGHSIYNNGTFDGIFYNWVRLWDSEGDPVNVLIAPLQQGRVLAVLYWHPSYYCLRSIAYSGSEWQPVGSPVPDSESPLLADERAITITSDLQTVYLVYASPVYEIISCKYTYSDGWQAVKTVTDYADACSFPAAYYRQNEVWVIWNVNDTDLYVSRLVNGSWTERVKIHSENETVYGASVNCFFTAQENYVGVAFCTERGEDTLLRMLYQPYIPAGEEGGEEEGGEAPAIPVMLIFGIVGIIMMILAPYLFVKKVKERDWNGCITAFTIGIVGFFIVVAWAMTFI